MHRRQRVEKRLLETTKYVKFEMHYDVDSELIGGMVIRIGDRVVDSSVRTKLYDLDTRVIQNTVESKVNALHEFKTRRNSPVIKEQIKRYAPRVRSS